MILKEIPPGGESKSLPPLFPYHQILDSQTTGRAFSLPFILST
ncbi:hypothetical protein X975_25841, partial [Stegodyphus mimosarum]